MAWLGVSIRFPSVLHLALILTILLSSKTWGVFASTGTATATETGAMIPGVSSADGNRNRTQEPAPAPAISLDHDASQEGPCETAIELLISPSGPAVSACAAMGVTCDACCGTQQSGASAFLSYDGRNPWKVESHRAMGNCLAVANDASSALNLDAFYAMQSLTGYPGQLGDYDQCAKVILFDESPQPVMQTHHCLAGSLSLSTNEGIVPFGGLCVPAACSPHMLSTPEFRSWLGDKAEHLQGSGTSTESSQHFLYNLLRHSELASNMNQGLTCGTYKRPDYGWDACAVTGGVCLLLVLIAYASCSDLINAADYPQSGRKVIPNGIGSQRIKYAGRNSRDMNDLYVLQEDHINKHLAAFSIPRNLTWLFSVGEANELSVFDGMRVLSMLWVVLGHILAVQSSIGYINPETVMPPGGLLATIIGQLFFSARFSVDTFFFVSGFLVVYAMLRRFKHDGHGIKVRRWSSWLPFFYLHRLLRITPPYVFSLLIWWKLAVFMGEGPYWYRWEFFIGLCDKYWWSNVSYVNNIVPWHQGETQECFYHAWYLADDMQFYIVSPLFIVLYMRRKWLGILATFAAIATSTAAMAIGTYVRGWSALTLDGAWVIKYSEETYTAPYFRIVSYLIGMLFAMLWHEKQMRWPSFKLADWQRYLMLSTSIALFGLVTFGGYSGYQNPPCSIFDSPVGGYCGSGWDRAHLAFYNAGTRPAWGVALILLCFVCFNGQGGLIQQMLAHRAWVPLARLSFGAYLLHPLIINLWFLNSTTKFHFSKLDLFMDYVCVAGVTFGSALVMALIVESPLTKLGRHLEEVLKPRERVQKVSTEYFAAEQSPGSINRYGLGRSADSMDEFLVADVQSREEGESAMFGIADGPSSSIRGARAMGSSNGNGHLRLSSVGERAALVAHTNPGYHDYMSQVTPRRRGSEAFG